MALRNSQTQTNKEAAGSKGSEPLSITHPEIASQWHYGKNQNLDPSQITRGSVKRIWWQCAVESTHVWQVSPDCRTRGKGTGCPYCAGKKVCDTNCLALLYPAVAQRWHPEKNGELKPTQVAPKSNKSIWWRCSVDETHEWQATVVDLVSKPTSGCPYCSGRKVSRTNNLATQYPSLAKNGTRKGMRHLRLGMLPLD